MSTVYFCWVCDKTIASACSNSAVHYETQRRVWFCSLAHLNDYMELAVL